MKFNNKFIILICLTSCILFSTANTVTAAPFPIFGIAKYGDGVNADGAIVELESSKGKITSSVGTKVGLDSGYWQVDCGDPHNWPTGTNFTLTITGIGNYENWSKSVNGTVSGSYVDMGIIVLINPNIESNLPPFADASAGEPYDSKVGETISFNASKSTDPDGYISSWSWDFDDGNKKTGKVVNHSYELEGEYNVTLEVTDSEGAVDSCFISVLVKSVEDTRPKSIISGPSNGKVKTDYDFTVLPTDNTDANISYIVEWGDGTNDTISNHTQANNSINIIHQWETTGIYKIYLLSDNKNDTISELAESIIAIDMNILFLKDYVEGYLVDNNQDEVFDYFHDNDSKKDISIKYQNDIYLLDIDGDGAYDYQINIEGNISSYQNQHDNQTAGFESILVIISVSILIFIRRKK